MQPETMFANKFLNYLAQCVAFFTLLCAANTANAALNFSFNASDQGSRPGEAFQVEWIVVNDGSTQENNITVEVPMPGSGINNIFESEVDGGDCPSNTCDAGETIVWSLGNIPAGESRMASFALVVQNSAPNAGIAMIGRLKKGASVISTSSWTQQVAVDLVAELAIDSSDAHVVQGTSFSYGILAGNTGTSPLNGAVLTVLVPSGLAIDSAPEGTISGNSVTWNLGNLPSGRVTRRVVNVTPGSGFGTGDLIVLNDATLSGTVFGVVQSTVADHVVTAGNPALMFQIRAQETQFKPGEQQNIEFVVSNTTNQVLQNTSVQLMYPHRLSSVFELESGGDCTSNTCDPGEQMIWDFGNLLPGETRQIRFSTGAASNAAEGRPVRWQASARSGANVVRRDYLATGNTSVDVNLQIDSDETRVSAGDVFTYTFNVGNIGTVPLDNVALTVPVPDNVIVLDTNGGSTSAGVVTWQLSDVAAGALKHRYLKVRANTGLVKGTLINLVDAQASATMFGIPQATMAQHFVAIGDAPIDLELRIQQETVGRGESMLMEIVASNTGTQVEQNVTATLLWPDDLASKFETNLETVICTSNTCDPGEQMVVPFGNLVPGETKSIIVALTALSAALRGEHVTWMGTVSAAGGLSRRFEATVGITDVATELQITADELLVAPGASVTYQLAAGNTGSGTGILSQAVLTVPVPEGMTVLAAPGGSIQSDQIIYNLGDIDDGEILIPQLTLEVPPSATNGTQFALENIELSGFLFGIEEMTYASHVITVGSSPIDSQISVSPVDAKAGDAVQITIDVINTGSQVEQDVRALLQYPHGVQSRFETDMNGGACPSNTCDPEEVVDWPLGNMTPGDTRTISFSTTILTSQIEGDMIEWSGRVQASSVKQRRMEIGSLVGDVRPWPGGDYCNGQLVTVDLSAGQTPTSRADVIQGTSGADTINAMGGDDVICGLGGADSINGGRGNDWIDAGEGDDYVLGAADNDTIFGDNGDDTLEGGPGNDDISGEGGDDTIRGNSGADDIDGGDGVDDINGGSGADIIATGAGSTVGTNSFVNGGSGNDIITGGPDDDFIRSSTDNDTINGGGGDDELFGGGGQDTINGEDGDDFIRGNAANDIVSGGSGVDNVDGGSSKDQVFGGPDNDFLKGSTGNDKIYGGSGDDDILGGGGNDDLFGEAGNDTILGGGSNDNMDGGSGTNDSCNGEGGIDTATACEVVSNVP